jgi:hypothetical protein
MEQVSPSTRRASRCCAVHEQAREVQPGQRLSQTCAQSQHLLDNPTSIGPINSAESRRRGDESIKEQNDEDGDLVNDAVALGHRSSNDVSVKEEDIKYIKDSLSAENRSGDDVSVKEEQQKDTDSIMDETDSASF